MNILTNDEQNCINQYGRKFLVEMLKTRKDIDLYVSAMNKIILNKIYLGETIDKDDYAFLQVASIVKRDFILTESQKEQMELIKKSKKCNC